ncbi:hypothetical protein SFA35_17480 [Pseudomonas sp. HR96]|uniref:hypothetical protein n=1 Tax=Pseudomonas sp. HR96 TaxID=1027966 RepID=UPI002A757116|nr:hypothetical protein [Pseudomonas sp. HR96]WPO98422.1 hypothetical protein SFA35_17480 [Pseudomonas sp. HR96]
MDNNKESGSNLAFWLPGSAVILSLLVSTFALTREPFLEARPVGAQFQAQVPIDARLWQDPFDALERFRKAAGKPDAKPEACVDSLPPPSDAHAAAPDLMLAMVEGGPHAETVEMRRRMRYALLAGFKNARWVPEDEQHLRCLRVSGLASAQPNLDLPYESFAANPFDPPADINEQSRPGARTLLFWVRQEDLGAQPLLALDALRRQLAQQTGRPDDSALILKVIGPATSSVLRAMYRDEAAGKASEHVEIYSPLATADYRLLTRNLPGSVPLAPPMKLIRTISDDGTLTRMLLDELKRRQVDPAAGVACAPGAQVRVGVPCNERRGRAANRVALVSEWDSFYSRALIESFKMGVAEDAGLDDYDPQRKPRAVAAIDNWVLRFSYLRGLDGLLPEDAASKAPADKDGAKSPAAIDLSPLEKADGNSQLDYLRRLAEQIASTDEQYRREGQSGIGAIGVLGYDTYDKLLVLQALKSRMPGKLFFSTNLDARMLQRGQAQTSRNVILAAPYGLTLTRALQQDVPPFRDSLQSSVFVAVLAAQSPQPFDAKRQHFDYARSGLLSPGIYEVGVSGFIGLASQPNASRMDDCAVPGAGDKVRGQDIMALRCLQDPVAAPYPQATQKLRAKFGALFSLFWAGPLVLVLLVLGVFLGGWWGPSRDLGHAGPRWVASLPLAFYLAAGCSAWIALRFWRVEFMWITFLLAVAALVVTEMNRRTRAHRLSVGALEQGVLGSRAWYVVAPSIVFILALMGAYEARYSLTEAGLGEPMYLFEGISAWPSMALRLLAVLFAVTALGWGWRKLCINCAEIEERYHLRLVDRSLPVSLWAHLPRLQLHVGAQPWHDWFSALAHCLFQVLFPLSPSTTAWSALPGAGGADARQRRRISIELLWREHCVCGTFGARLLRAGLATWVYMVLTSMLFVVWPMDGSPIRGQILQGSGTWLLPTLVFQLLVFWVMDANRLLTRFIHQLSTHHGQWPKTLRLEHQRKFGLGENHARHPCIDDWLGVELIARRSAAVSRLVYAPTIVLLILLASRSSLFDNWPTPPSLVISYLLTACLLLCSALSLRRAAEKARVIALLRIDEFLFESLEEQEQQALRARFEVIRKRVADLRTGAFSRYSDEPMVRAVLLSLTGIGGSAIVDALNYAKF